jgi:5-oxoprolinase (ATP-hydrolysing)
MEPHQCRHRKPRRHGGFRDLGRNRVERTGGKVEQLGGCDQTEMQPGDVFVIETPGGGGFGVG